MDRELALDWGAAGICLITGLKLYRTYDNMTKKQKEEYKYVKERLNLKEP